MSVRFTIPGQPVSWERLRTSGRRRYESPKVAAQKALIKACASIAFNKANREPLTCLVRVEIGAVMTRPKRKPKDVRSDVWKTGRRILAKGRNDVDNIAKLVLDSMEGIAYANDRSVVVVLVAKGYAAVDEEACTEVGVFETTAQGVAR